MRRIENDCCSCSTNGYPCLGDQCLLRKMPHYYCDDCKEEFEPSELYQKDGKELCGPCVLKAFEQVHF